MKEAEVQRLTGVSRGVLRQFRGTMQPGVHYRADRDGVVYTEAGLEALSVCGVVLPSKKPVAPLDAALAAGGGLAPETMPAGPVASANGKKLAHVTRVFGINTAILEAELVGGPKVRVRVRDNQMFVPGQEIPVVPQPDTPVWLLACRQPRVRGRLSW